MLAHEKPLHVAAGLFLIYLGLKSFWAKKTSDEGERSIPARGWARDLATAVLLTLTNPPTIIMFAAVFTALAPTNGLDASAGLATIAGVFTGSLAWWCFIVLLASGFRHAIGVRARGWIDRISGAALAALGIVEMRRSLL
jgi:threonine/homoserine/homoserine lactone efflux protein